MCYYLILGSNIVLSAKGTIHLVLCNDFTNIGIKAGYTVYLIRLCATSNRHKEATIELLSMTRMIVELVVPPCLIGFCGLSRHERGGRIIKRVGFALFIVGCYM